MISGYGTNPAPYGWFWRITLKGGKYIIRTGSRGTSPQSQRWESIPLRRLFMGIENAEKMVKDRETGGLKPQTPYPKYGTKPSYRPRNKSGQFI